MVVRKALFGRQSSGTIGSCKHTGQATGSEAWPDVHVSVPKDEYVSDESLTILAN